MRSELADPSPDDILRASGLLDLGEDPSPTAIHAAVLELGRLAEGADELTREAVRACAIRMVRPFGWRAAAVDAALGVSSNEGVADKAGSTLALTHPETWPHPVACGDLLDALERTFRRYLAASPEALTAFALWTLHAHAHAAAEVSPLLALTSPEKRCGKSTALYLLGALVPRPLPTSNVTAAALFRAIEKFQPTLLIDEADTFLRDSDDLRGVLNSGHARSSASVLRTAGDAYEPRVFATWAPKVLAMIGKLPDTLADRSVIISMKRRRASERVEPLRLDRLAGLEPLRRQAWTWAQQHLDVLRGTEPSVPRELHDRAADNWRPLLAIADFAGGVWGRRARDAAKALAGVDDGEDGSVRTLLLSDIRAVYEVRGVDRLRSEEIASALVEMEHRPWPEWGRSRMPLTPTTMAALLKPFGIRPGQLKIDGEKTRGYKRGWFEEAFDRYVVPPADDPVRPVPASNGARNGRRSGRYRPGEVPVVDSFEKARSAGKVPEVPPATGRSARGDLSDLDDLLEIEVMGGGE